MEYVDAHVHLDERIPGPASAAVGSLCAELRTSGIQRAFLLHLISQRWSLDEVAEALRSEEDLLVGFANIDPLDKEATATLTAAIKELGYRGLKLHPRQQDFAPDDIRVQSLVRLAGRLRVPVVIDVFPDGDWLQRGWSMASVARLAVEAPDTRIVAAHLGGHHCIDLMMLAKRISNLYLDLSFSLLYFRGSSVISDLVYCCKSMRFKKVLYGSDSPDRSIAESLDESLKVLKEHEVPDEGLERLLATNANEFLNQ